MHKQIFYAAGFTVLRAFMQIAVAVPITVGSFDASRTSLPFDGGAFEQARAALLANFDSITDVGYPTIPNQPIPVDLLFLTNAGMTAPLSPAERRGLLDFVNRGGTLLLSVFSDGTSPTNETAECLLAPFGAASTGMPSTGTTFYPTIRNAPSPIFTGVDFFANTDASGLLGAADAIAVASGAPDPVLLYYPTIPNLPVPRIGEVIIYSNESAFVDSAEGGQFRENRQLFINVATAAVGNSIPEPGTLLLVAVGVAMCGRRATPRLV